MSELSTEDIDHLTKLARLTLSAEEKDKFASQLPEILEFVDQLSVVANMLAEPQVTAVPLAKLRNDEEAGTKLSLEELKQLAPAWNNNKVEVPAMFDK